MRNLRKISSGLTMAVMIQAFVAMLSVAFDSEYRFLSLIILLMLLSFLIVLNAVVAFMEDLQEMREDEAKNKYR